LLATTLRPKPYSGFFRIKQWGCLKLDMPFIRYLCFGFLITATFWLTGCGVTQLLAFDNATPIPSSSPIIVPTIAPTPKPTGDWVQLQPGLEKRTIDFIKDGQHQETIYLLRLEPDNFQFGVAYEPQGLTLEAWQDQTGALLIINGGYYRQEGEIYFPNGLTIIDGIPMGSSFGDFGGMFAVSESGPKLRWLAQQPFNPNEPIIAALQSFPILVKPGGELGFPVEHDDNIATRRTAIAQDQLGRILFIVAPQGNLTLHQLSDFLTNAGLQIDIAINLDGGPSSGILLAEPSEKIPALSPLPIVITVSTQ
jgi:hypothetical protein